MTRPLDTKRPQVSCLGPACCCRVQQGLNPPECLSACNREASGNRVLAAARAAWCDCTHVHAQGQANQSTSAWHMLSTNRPSQETAKDQARMHLLHDKHHSVTLVTRISPQPRQFTLPATGHGVEGHVEPQQANPLLGTGRAHSARLCGTQESATHFGANKL
jgi:hypothetical protein